MVRAGRREQVVRGEDEILFDPIARLQLRRHQAGDVEHDFLVIDRRDAARRRAHLYRNGRVIIGKRLHPGVFRQCEERERHQRAFAADLAMQRAVEREQIALGDAVGAMGRTIRSRVGNGDPCGLIPSPSRHVGVSTCLASNPPMRDRSAPFGPPPTLPDRSRKSAASPLTHGQWASAHRYNPRQVTPRALDPSPAPADTRRHRHGRDRARPAPKEQPPRKLSGRRTMAMRGYLERGAGDAPLRPPTG
ncbi:hypothetical protein WR25_23204 [Diploscapter pachys]|uniref:Uncharacterized protein n=1 Tax=Diploscapter pachys TaxID=2018661 RepID=A0A2A2KC16_9BILA|nr:hypothetical protein WR25_23204 [Diploscapter pachys]